MENDILAKEVFRLWGKTIDGRDYDGKVVTTLRKSGAFEYGNRTCMIWEYDDGRPVDCFDTRYEKVNVKTFREFAQKCLRERTADSIAIECITEN